MKSEEKEEKVRNLAKSLKSNKTQTIGPFWSKDKTFKSWKPNEYLEILPDPVPGIKLLVPR